MVDNPAIPVAPSRMARATWRPLGLRQVRIDDGFWYARQTLNREASLPHGARMLEEYGALDNLRIAAGRISGTYRGMVFNDSDVYKWLEAAAWELARAPSDLLQSLIDEMVAVIEQAQAPDGYLHSYHQIMAPDRRFTDLQHGHELYCAGHLMQAAVALQRSCGDGRLIAVAARLADYVDSVFSPATGPALCGHPEVEMALVELYRETGVERYLRLAQTLVDRRGYGRLGRDHIYHSLSYYQDHEPMRQAHTLAGHAVRALYLAAGAADLVLETSDTELHGALLRQWDDMVATKLYLTGGTGSRHHTEAFGEAYELPSDRAYCETCAGIASVMWSWRMLLLTGDGAFADLIERTLFNAIAVSPSMDGTRWFYSNPLESPGHQERASWFEVACCPPNVMRTWSSLGQYLATTDASGVQIHQYAGSELRAAFGEGRAVSLHIDTEYPWDGHIAITVAESTAGEWELALRVPAWCDAWAVSIQGRAAEVGKPLNGYVRICRHWQPGDTISLDLGMPARFTAPHPRVDALRGCLAIERGPLVYCLETVDQDQGVDLRDITVDPSQPLKEVDEPQAAGGWVRIEATGNGRSVDEPERLYGQYRAAAPGGGAPVTLRAVPYFSWANRGVNRMRVWIPRL